MFYEAGTHICTNARSGPDCSGRLCFMCILTTCLFLYPAVVAGFFMGFTTQLLI